MHFNAMAIRVIQEHLVPTRNGPATIVRVFDAEFITAAHEALDVIGAETEVAMSHRVDILLHFESGFQVTFRPVELNVAVGQKIHFSRVRAIFPDAAHNRVLLVSNRAKVKKGSIELSQTRQVVSTDVHVMELEIHRNFLWLGLGRNPSANPSGTHYFDEQKTSSMLCAGR